MKTISVLFIKYGDTTSALLDTWCRQSYTHCSIGLGESPVQYYSFNYHGFACESMEMYKRSGIGDVHIIHIEVTEYIYDAIARRIEEFNKHRITYYYTRLGVACCVFHIPFHWKHAYFCSHFVAEILALTHCIKLKKKAYQYLPSQLQQELTRGCVGATSSI